MYRRIIVIFYLLIPLKVLIGQDQLIYKYEYLPGNDTVWIFKPGNYDTLKDYPVLYLLHGWSGNYKQWSELVDLQYYSDELDFLIVCPDGFYDSFYLNSPKIKNSQFESFFIDILYPSIISNYSVDKERIFISGLSMGGGGAMFLFLRHSQLFLSAGSTSGLMDLSYSGNRDKKLSELLGEYSANKEIFDQFSPINMLVNIKGSGKEIIFDCGTSDHLFDCNERFKSECDKNGIKATYITGPGNHNKEYWKKSIIYHFMFFKKLAE